MAAPICAPSSAKTVALYHCAALAQSASSTTRPVCACCSSRDGCACRGGGGGWWWSLVGSAEVWRGLFWDMDVEGMRIHVGLFACDARMKAGGPVGLQGIALWWVRCG